MIDLLPKDCKEFPILFSEEDVNHLEGSDFEYVAREVNLEIFKYYMKIGAEIHDFRINISLEEFTEMWCIVNSRNFMICIDGTDVDCLVPYADMLNHKLPA